MASSRLFTGPQLGALGRCGRAALAVDKALAEQRAAIAHALTLDLPRALIGRESGVSEATVYRIARANREP